MFKTGDDHLIEFREEWKNSELIIERINVKKYWAYDYSYDKFVQQDFSFHEIGDGFEFIKSELFCLDKKQAAKEVFVNKRNCMLATAKALQDEAKHYDRLSHECNVKAQKILKAAE